MNYYIKVLLIISNMVFTHSYIITMGIIDKNYKIVKYKVSMDDAYLDLKLPKKPLVNKKKCDICGELINVKLAIPYNCTIPLGCPFNRKRSK